MVPFKEAAGSSISTECHELSSVSGSTIHGVGVISHLVLHPPTPQPLFVAGSKDASYSIAFTW